MPTSMQTTAFCTTSGKRASKVMVTRKPTGAVTIPSQCLIVAGWRTEKPSLRLPPPPPPPPPSPPAAPTAAPQTQERGRLAFPPHQDPPQQGRPHQEPSQQGRPQLSSRRHLRHPGRQSLPNMGLKACWRRQVVWGGWQIERQSLRRITTPHPLLGGLTTSSLRDLRHQQTFQLQRFSRGRLQRQARSRCRGHRASLKTKKARSHLCWTLGTLRWLSSSRW